MKVQLMNIQRQHETYASDYEDAMLRVVRSGNYIGGEEVALFEKEFAEYEGAKYGISCGNGTDAIVIALRALGIGCGDEVITVAWTFFATAESIAAVGAKPVFIDVCSDTYCMNPELIESAITGKTKAVLPVHFYGNSCDMDKIREICKKHNLYLIMDCAQSVGTEYKGTRKGTLGDVSCFSFFPTKNLGCAGDGGMILTDDENIASACKALKLHGSGKDGLNTYKRLCENNGREIPNNIPVGETKYYNYLVGYNSRLDALQAAILRKKLTHIDEFVKGRRKNAKMYDEAFKKTTYVTPKEGVNSYHSYYIYALKHDNAIKIIESLNENGVACGIYYPVPLHLQGAFAYLGYKEGDLPVSENLSKTTFAIPVFPELYDDERNYVIEQVIGALRK
ncbi:MAG: DegT/DnrJ/EryC1/StrS family aminotransferase [Lachnospiraceae bacterium]|nr:DegT/DnrJ/EryC1/StrS family aminotransferase [Lachnospiraceae bacterium]